MGSDKAIKQPIVEELYAQALVLADEARTLFDMRGKETADNDNVAMRMALSVEGLRTTTRVMNILAWLLNQRAYLQGELSSKQIMKHGALADERPSDPKNLASLLPDAQYLIRESEKMYHRIARLDTTWRDQANDDADRTQSSVHSMQSMITQAFCEGSDGLKASKTG
ncbi:DUF1465 family protein [Erythrobacter sp. W53]|uniref:DUF1465 family protein n=1 Tax=Erythrobacter sp. W53 TaxID=3425947 RepID=UPI003D7682BE